MKQEFKENPTRSIFLPLLWIALCWAAGLIAQRAIAPSFHWSTYLIAASLLWLTGFWLHRKNHFKLSRLVALTAVILLGACRWQLHEPPQINPTDEGILVSVQGRIIDEPSIRITSPGAMGSFDYRGPRTRFTLKVTRMIAGSPNPLTQSQINFTSSLIVDLPAYDNRLTQGDRVQCLGWLLDLSQPTNAGSFNYQRAMLDRGIAGRLILKTRGNCTLLNNSGTLTDRLRAWRSAWIERARSTFAQGFTNSPGANLIEALVLGNRSAATNELSEDFRKTGLAHLLAVSGLHLGILVLGAWRLTLSITGRPRLALFLAMAIVIMYLVIAPWRVPVVRAAVMTLTACWALSRGRGASILGAMALAGLGLLIWRPGDLFNAGFQLSFGVVTGLVFYVSRVSQWLFPKPRIDQHPTARWYIRRYLIDYLAVTIVAWCFSMPLIAYHFGQINPIALALGVMALPVVVLILWAGYLKLAIGFIFPDIANLIASPLEAIANTATHWVNAAAQLPGAGIALPQAQGAWAFTTLLVIAAIFTGLFHNRKIPLAACLLICSLWLYAPVIQNHFQDKNSALRLTMFDVGDGSAYLLQSNGQTLIFDCGSANRLDITSSTIAPALHALGVMSVDTLVISHPDIDHFSGGPELIDHFNIQRILLTQVFLDEAAARPTGAAAFFIRYAKSKDVNIQTLHAGWSQSFGHASLKVLWPPANARGNGQGGGGGYARHNDTSLVLSAEAANRRALLTGDIQADAMRDMTAANLNTQADILELPHHGSFPPGATTWVNNVNAKVILQSTGPTRLENDRWASTLNPTHRHVSEWHGMTTVTIKNNSHIKVQRFIEKPVATNPSPHVK